MLERVKVYFNLHKKCWSVKSMDTGEDYGKVKYHATSVELFHAVPKVSKAGQARVRREKKKNVHAGILGRMNWFDDRQESIDYAYNHNVNNKRANPKWREITYNPYKHDTFVYVDTGEEFTGADRVYLLDKKVYAR